MRADIEDNALKCGEGGKHKKMAGLKSPLKTVALVVKLGKLVIEKPGKSNQLRR